MMKTNYVMCVTTGQKFDIKSFIDSNTDFVVFGLECCGCFYIWRTMWELKTRLAEHKH